MDTGSLTRSQRETLAVFGDTGEPRGTGEVAEHLDLGRRSTYDRLERLADKGYLETKKVGASARVWWRPITDTEETVPRTNGESTATTEGVQAEPGEERQRGDLETELKLVIDRISDGVYGLDEDLRFTYVNDPAAELLGVEESDLLGCDIRETHNISETFHDALQEALRSGEPITLQDYSEYLGTWFEDVIYPSETGLSVYVRDVTERKNNEETLTALYDSTRALLDAESEDEVASAVVETANDILDLDLVGAYLYDEAEGHLYPAAKAGEPDFLRTELPPLRVDDSIAGHVYSTGVSQRFDDATDSPRLQTDTTGMRGGVFVPMGKHGVLIVGSTEAGVYDERTERLIELLAANAEAAFERVERERTLRKSEQRYRTLAENFPNGAVALLDDELRYTLIEGRGFDKLDYAASDLRGERLQDVFSEDILDILEPNYRAALDGEPNAFELETQGRTFEVRVLPLTDEDGDVFAIMAMTQDVTERIERERDLQRHARQQEVIANLGHRALEDRDLDTLMAAAVEQVAETLDNDFCKILELDEDTSKLRLCQGVGWDDGVVGTATVSAAEDNSQAAYTLTTDQPVVVEDLRTDSRFSLPDLLVDHNVRGGISTIIGSRDDPWGILGTHDTDPRRYSEQDVTFVQSVANILATAIARHHHEQELIHQREQLTALNNLNTIVREITDAVIEQSTREEIEEIVVERLASSDSYLFAWVGEVDVHSGTVELQTEAGVEGYLDGITISVDPDDERSQGPTGQAILHREMRVTNDLYAEPSHDPWRDHVEEYGFRSSAAIPIVHEGTTYGVLNVYAERPNAFTDEEREVIGRLGEIVGHAIAAVERRKALMSDEVVELEFKIRNLVDAFGLAMDVDIDGSVDLEHVVPIGDGNYLEYGTATGDAFAIVEALVASVSFPHWESVTVLDSNEEETRFELRLTDPPIISTVAKMDGSLREAHFEDGDFYMRVHLPPATDVRSLVDVVTETYPRMKMITQRQVTRDHRSSTSLKRELLGELTERQRSAIEAAYYSGFFEWPRDTTGEEIAASLAVSPSTFHQHLRKGQRKVLSAVIAE